MRFSGEAPRNALATPPSIRPASTVISRHYANRTHYRVRALKVTTPVDVETLYIIEIHSTTSKKYDAKICPQVARRNVGDLWSLAADHGYDAKSFRDELRENGIRPLIKYPS